MPVVLHKLMLAAVGALAIGWTSAALGQAAASSAATPPAAATAADQEAIARHVLNRMAFGPRPGEVERVAEMGWRNWVRQQLDPDDIDDSACLSQVARRWPSLTMSMSEAFNTYRPAYDSDPPTQEEVRRRNMLRGRIKRELAESVLYRATFSERQFEEVIVEFWRSHFNIDHNKDDTAYLANHYDQQVLRRFAFGKFEHLLLATATHPAMLIYLDNIVSQKPLTDRELAMVTKYENRKHVPRFVDGLLRHRGLNENYARELMELHTLGVDNGYTQGDVTEVARALTGWSAGWADENGFIRDSLDIEPGGYGFVYRERVHDEDPKIILGRRFTGSGGVSEGVTILRGLARDRRTAEFISRKLCAYLVRDEPPEALVQRVAKVFRDTHGDLPSVYEAIVLSDEFISPSSVGCKFKTPFEFVVSSLRATDAPVKRYGGLLSSLHLMGQPIYGCEDPIGYEDQAEAWLDPGVMVYRWMFALGLPGGEVHGVAPPQRLIQSLEELPAARRAEYLMDDFIPGRRPGEHDRALREAVEAAATPQRALGLVLGSPAFQQQ